MRQTLSLSPNFKLNQLIAFILLEIVLLFCIAFISFGNECQAFAQTLTPEAKSYQVDKTSDNLQINPETAKNKAENLGEKAQEKAESLKENIVEKLNLNEPTPPSTKKFFKQIQGKEPIEDTTPR